MFDNEMVMFETHCYMMKMAEELKQYPEFRIKATKMKDLAEELYEVMSDFESLIYEFGNPEGSGKPRYPKKR